MWILKFRQRHDCLLGNRCQEFGVTLQGVNFSTYHENNDVFTASMHAMSGSTVAMNNFVKSLKRDISVVSLDRKGDTLFLLEKHPFKAVGFHNPKIIFLKPVLMRPDGWEDWELASWDRNVLAVFLKQVRSTMPEFVLLRFSSVAINNIFFPRLLPSLTTLQKQAFELAIAQGYYKRPRKTDLRSLARLSGVSLATFQQHLRVAEEKLIPHLLFYTK